MRKVILVICCVLCVFVLFAQDEKNGISFAGGMFVQPSLYQSSSSMHDGFAFGLGGMLKFQLSDHLFFGTTGGAMRRNYNTQDSENSYIELGYGGLMGGWYSDFEKWRLSAQLFGGMGKKSNLDINVQSGDLIIGGSYSEQLVLILSPSIGSEYFMSDKISFLLQAELMTGFVKAKPDFFIPVLRFGILFNR